MKNYFIIVLSFFLFISCINYKTMNEPTPPSPIKEEQLLSIHGDDRIDNYFWMRLSDAQKEAKEPDEQT